jgi:RNA polymerase sigma-70 factor (ECF subfamily)
MDLDADVELLLEVKNGNPGAYEGIMRRHNQRLFRIARSIVRNDDDAMDVVQESYIKAFDNVGDLVELRAFATWIARIVKNNALMRLRKNRRYVQMDDEQLENVVNLSVSASQGSRPDKDLANKQLGHLLEYWIDELPENFRTVFMLRSVEGCDTRTTATILEINEATVKTRLHRAKTLMKNKVQDYCDQAGTTVHEFAGHRCDAIVRHVLDHFRGQLDR